MSLPSTPGTWCRMPPTKSMVAGRGPLLTVLLAGLRVFEGDHDFEVAFIDAAGNARHLVKLTTSWMCSCRTFAAAGTCRAAAYVHLVRATNGEVWK